MTRVRERGGFLYVWADGFGLRVRLDRPEPPCRIPLENSPGFEEIRGVVRLRAYSAAAPYPWPCGRQVPPCPRAE